MRSPWKALLPLALLLAAVPVRGTSRWVPLGPFGGSIETLTVDPTDSRVLYATLGTSGAFRSLDGGASWIPIRGGIAGGSVAVDPARPSTIYLSSSQGGLRKSADRGAHWTATGLPAGNISALAVDPARPSRLYAGTSAGEIFRSVDGGASWKPARRGLPASYDPRVQALLAVPRPLGTAFALTLGGVFKSTDGGDSWKPAVRGLPGGAFLSLAVAPSDPRTLYASLRSADTPLIFRSSDGGASWQEPARQPVSSGTILSLAVSARSPKAVWAGAEPGGLYRSEDGGAHWTATGPVPKRKVTAVAAAPSSPRTVYLGVAAEGLDLGGVFASADNGVSWTRRNQGLTGLDARALAITAGDPPRLWAGLSDQGLFRSANGGKRWARMPLQGPFQPPHGFPIQELAAAPSAPSTLYVLYASWLWRTDDAGASWAEVQGLSGPALRFLRADPLDPAKLWSSFGSGLAVSTDGGASWTRPPLPGLGCRGADLAFAPSAPATLYAAGAKSAADCNFAPASVIRSTDGGTSWTDVGGGLRTPPVEALAVDPVDPRLVYAGTGGGFYGAGDGVWRSADGGGSWARAGEELAGRPVLSVAASPLPGVVWAVAADLNRGAIFRSGDGGATWQERGEGLQAFTVYRLAIDPGDPRRIYAATTGGIWTLEDDEP